MRKDEREALRQRYHFSCGYCGVSEKDVGAELTVDHFLPQSLDGPDSPENWVYCCHACNEFKGDFQQVDSLRRLLHPLLDDITVHIREQEDGILRGLTEVGAFHITRLRLNRPQLVSYRYERRLRQQAHELQAAIFGRLQQLDEQVQKLSARIEDIERGRPES